MREVTGYGFTGYKCTGCGLMMLTSVAYGYGLGTHIHELRLAGNELCLAGLQPSKGCLIIDRN